MNTSLTEDHGERWATTDDRASATQNEWEIDDRTSATGNEWGTGATVRDQNSEQWREWETWHNWNREIDRRTGNSGAPDSGPNISSDEWWASRAKWVASKDQSATADGGDRGPTGSGLG